MQSLQRSIDLVIVEAKPRSDVPGAAKVRDRHRRTELKSVVVSRDSLEKLYVTSPSVDERQTPTLPPSPQCWLFLPLTGLQSI